MAYKYEESNKQIIYTVDNESSMDKLNERINELHEVYRKAKAWDNYMVDTYIYDKVYSDGDHKEAYDFYMKLDVKSYIDCLNKELADTGHFINSVEEYKQILNEIEDKQND